MDPRSRGTSPRKRSNSTPFSGLHLRALRGTPNLVITRSLYPLYLIRKQPDSDSPGVDNGIQRRSSDPSEVRLSQNRER